MPVGSSIEGKSKGRKNPQHTMRLRNFVIHRKYTVRGDPRVAVACLELDTSEFSGLNLLIDLVMKRKYIVTLCTL